MRIQHTTAAIVGSIVTLSLLGVAPNVGAAQAGESALAPERVALDDTYAQETRSDVTLQVTGAALFVASWLGPPVVTSYICGLSAFGGGGEMSQTCLGDAAATLTIPVAGPFLVLDEPSAGSIALAITAATLQVAGLVLFVVGTLLRKPLPERSIAVAPVVTRDSVTLSLTGTY